MRHSPPAASNSHASAWTASAAIILALASNAMPTIFGACGLLNQVLIAEAENLLFTKRAMPSCDQPEHTVLPLPLHGTSTSTSFCLSKSSSMPPLRKQDGGTIISTLLLRVLRMTRKTASTPPSGKMEAAQIETDPEAAPELKRELDHQQRLVMVSVAPAAPFGPFWRFSRHRPARA